MKKVTLTLVYDDTERLRPDRERLGKALQELYLAAHHDAGVSFGMARLNWTKEHQDVPSP